jgi:uronate dehydrogenase
MRIAITGAAGNVGNILRERLDRSRFELLLLDVNPIEAAPPDRAQHVDLRDASAVRAAFEGVEAVVHLGAIPTEDTFERILEHNIVGTRNVYDAAVATGVRRVVYASTVHVTGFYPWNQPTSPADPPRPDTFYALSKLTGENLGRLYHDRFGVEVVNLRICGFAREPQGPWLRRGWLSFDDAVRLVTAALTAPDIGFLTCYGVSANTRRLFSDDGWAELGYAPVDDAEEFAAGDDRATPTWQGEPFTDDDYLGTPEHPRFGRRR